MRSVLVVARVAADLWRRGIAGALSVSERSVRLASGVILLFAAALSAVLYWLVSAILVQTDSAAYQGDTRALLRLVFAGLFIGTLLFLLLLCSSAPERTALGTVLLLTPVSRHARVIGPFLPFVLVGSLASLLIGFPSMSLVFRLDVRETIPVTAIALFLWLVAWSSVTFTALFFVVKALVARWFVLPPGYGMAMAAAVCAVCGFALSGIDLIPVRRSLDHAWWQDLTPTRAVSDLVVEGGGVAPLCALGLWTALTVALVWVLGRVGEPSSTRSFSRALVGWGAPQGRVATRVWLEIVLIARLPQFVVVSAVSLGGAIGFPLLYVQPATSATISDVAALVVVVPCAIGLYSYGASQPSHWVAGAVTGRRAGWVIPKALAAALVSIVLVTPYLVVMALVGLPGDQLLDIASLGAAVLASSLTIGLLLPCEPGRALAATVSSVVLSLAWVVVVIAPRWLAVQVNIGPPWLVTLVASMVVVLAYVRLAAWSVERRRGIA